MRRFLSGCSIRAKLILIVAGTLIVAIAAVALQIRGLVYGNIVSQKLTTVDILTASLVHDIKYGFHPDKTEVVPVIIAKYLTYYRIIQRIAFYSPQLHDIADSITDRIGQTTTDAAIVAAVTTATPSVSITQSDWKSLGIRSIAPVLQGSRIVGAVVIDVSIQDIQTTLSEIDRRIVTILIITVLVASAILFAILRGSILARLSRLMNVTQQLAAGNYDIEVGDHRKDEIGALGQSFDRMTNDLRRSKGENENYNKHLEEMVREQTSALQRAYEDLKNTQGQLVLNEKMASLGVLIAGIAHEINTPIGAIHNIARNLNSKVQSLPKALDDFRSCPDIGRFPAFLEELIAAPSYCDQRYSFTEIRAVENILREHGVDRVRETASVLAKLKFGSPEKVKEYIDCIRNPVLIQLAESFASITQAARISETSSQKIAEIVRALKYYAYTDKGQFEKIQINESIQTALILLRNRLKHTTSIVTRLAPDLPLVHCTNEVHQVWTNLLTNACDAIEAMGEDYRGEIRITTHARGEQIVVTIADNGDGLAEDNLNKIFDPFFTTKAIGKGTGLGLSIVSGIVKKHRGAIHVTSRRAPTVFEVTLPLSLERSDDEGQGTDNREEIDETGHVPPRVLSQPH